MKIFNITHHLIILGTLLMLSGLFLTLCSCGKANTQQSRVGDSPQASLSAGMTGQAYAVDHSEALRDSKSLVLSIPIPKSPLNGAVISAETISFSWSACPGAVRYRIETSQLADFTIINALECIDTISIQSISLMSAPNMFWRVRSEMNDTVYSGWSEVNQFTVQQAVVIPPPYGGCNGDCSHCTHPCGRRPPPIGIDD